VTFAQGYRITMGSMIQLAVGRLEIDWGKNNGFVDHSALFQATDVKNVPYYYADDVIEYKEGLSKPLKHVIERMNLLGHTHGLCEKEFELLAGYNGFDRDRFCFSDLQRALATVDVNSLSVDYGELGEDFGKFFRREIFPRLGLNTIAADPAHAQYDAAQGMENLTPYSILHLLSANPSAQEMPVQWAFNDVEDGGWAKRSDFVRLVDQSSRFLIVTEGSSDAHIIRHALRLLKPHVADFFDFVDMEEGYPFSGTGNIFRFVQGLIAISVLNNVLVVYDNDAEGAANFRRCHELKLPSNLKILKLPDLTVFERVRTIGPNGTHEADINGQAAAIECYLNLDPDARVRWTSFNSKLDVYQGELIDKGVYMRKFLDQREKIASYDYGKIAAVLDMIINSAVAMREAVMERQYLDAYEDRLVAQ
jgi:HEPN/Toprim N-terminal domain 1